MLHPLKVVESQQRVYLQTQRLQALPEYPSPKFIPDSSGEGGTKRTLISHARRPPTHPPATTSCNTYALDLMPFQCAHPGPFCRLAHTFAAQSAIICAQPSKGPPCFQQTQHPTAQGTSNVRDPNQAHFTVAYPGISHDFKVLVPFEASKAHQPAVHFPAGAGQRTPRIWISIRLLQQPAFFSLQAPGQSIHRPDPPRPPRRCPLRPDRATYDLVPHLFLPGPPHSKPAHLPAPDCAQRSRPGTQRSRIQPMSYRFQLNTEPTRKPRLLHQYDEKRPALYPAPVRRRRQSTPFRTHYQISLLVFWRTTRPAFSPTAPSYRHTFRTAPGCDER